MQERPLPDFLIIGVNDKYVAAFDAGLLVCWDRCTGGHLGGDWGAFGQVFCPWLAVKAGAVSIPHCISLCRRAAGLHTSILSHVQAIVATVTA